MAKRPSNNRGSNSAAVTNDTNLKEFLIIQFNLDDVAALERVKALISIAEALSSFEELGEEVLQPSKGTSSFSADQRQAVDPHIMVDHMEAGFLCAFEDAFGTERANNSNFVGYMMEKLENGGIIDEIMEEFPASSEDMTRLGRMEGGDEAYESLPPATVGFICESLLSEADTAESKVVATRKITALVELFARVHRQVGRRGPSTETIVDLNWALKQLVILTEVHLRGETLESDWPMEAETDDEMPTGEARATAEGKTLLGALGELLSD